MIIFDDYKYNKIVFSHLVKFTVICSRNRNFRVSIINDDATVTLNEIDWWIQNPRRLFGQQVLSFQRKSSWDPTRYVPGTSFKPQMIVYQNIRQANVNPMEPSFWRPVELVNTYQAHWSLNKKVICQRVQPLWETTPIHFQDLPARWGELLNLLYLPL